MDGNKIEINELVKDIYIRDFYELINEDKFKIIQREKNELFINQFRLDKSKIKTILLSLEKSDIQYQVDDREYIKYGPESLIVFKKQINLVDIYGRNRNEVVYIKVKFKKGVLPIISFHLDE